MDSSMQRCCFHRGADRDYGQADPSFMAVSAAIRYWRKHHPGEVELLNAPRSDTS
jgi:hypothetical protein